MHALETLPMPLQQRRWFYSVAHHLASTPLCFFLDEPLDKSTYCQQLTFTTF